MKLIVGLGNPGKKYERTRHNVGFLIIDELIRAFRLSPTSPNKGLQADLVKDTIHSKRVLLAKPETYMNNSGVAVRAVADFYKLTPDNLLIIHDDKDIPLGDIRVQKDRGAAGHNGVLSIIEHLGTKNFTRLRVGIAPRETPIPDTANFVLNNFTKEEQASLSEVMPKIINEIEKMLK